MGSPIWAKFFNRANINIALDEDLVVASGANCGILRVQTETTLDGKCEFVARFFEILQAQRRGRQNADSNSDSCPISIVSASGSLSTSNSSTAANGPVAISNS